MTTFVAKTDRQTTRRFFVIAALFGVAVVHLVNDIVGTYHENPIMFWSTLSLIGASVLTAELLTRSSSQLVWVAAGALGAISIVAFTISRTVGLPGDHGDDIGNWSEPLGLAALLIEAVIVLEVISHVLETRGRHALN
jgi:hypothetical protein